MTASRTQNGWRRRRIIMFPARPSPLRRSHMDRALADRKRGFLDGFRTSRMGVAGAREILGGTAELHQYGGFVDHFAGFTADYMHAKHPIGLRICENLNESFRGLVDLGTAIGGEWEFAGGIGDAGLLQLFLGLADGGDFRRGIHNTWNDVVIHMTGLAREYFRNRDAFILGLVRQHRTGNDIADCVNALHAGRKMRIDLHPAPIVERDASFLQPE